MSVDEYLVVRKTKRCVQFASNGLSGLQFNERATIKFIKSALDNFDRVEQVGEAEMFNLWDEGGWHEMYDDAGGVKWELVTL